MDYTVVCTLMHVFYGYDMQCRIPQEVLTSHIEIGFVNENFQYFILIYFEVSVTYLFIDDFWSNLHRGITRFTQGDWN